METNERIIVDSVETLESTIARVREAQKKFATYTQEQVDEIFKAAAIAANQARIPLAKQAVEETGMGNVESKIAKNRGAKKSTLHTVQIINDSLAAMGAPKNLVQCIEESSIHKQQALSAA